jgi:hypothetical protein
MAYFNCSAFNFAVLQISRGQLLAINCMQLHFTTMRNHEAQSSSLDWEQRSPGAQFLNL